MTNKSLNKKIIEIFKIYDNYWNTKNIEKWSDLFTNNVDFVIKRGVRIKSKEVLLRVHKRIMEGFSEIGQNMNHHTKVEEIEMLSKNIVLVSAIWEWPEFIPSPNANTISYFNGVSTVIIEKNDDLWLIRAMHSSVNPK